MSAETGNRPRLTYRPELDGIRGVAILLVLVGHTNIGHLGMASAVGVSLFFVLSGYLITGILIDERRRTGRISLQRFYERRARRLLPAVLALVAVLLVLGQVTAPTGLAALFYSSNLVISTGGTMGLLSHTWSLSLEEQFYAVWAVLMVVLPRRAMLAAAMVCILASLAMRFVVVPSDLTLYRPDVRMDALMWGCLLALVRVRLPTRVAVFCWGLLVIVSLLPWTPATLLGGSALAAVASVLLVATARPGWLSRPWLVRIGVLSYGLYLWHYPPAILLDPFTRSDNPWAIGLVWVFAFAAAIASERWIERPWRLGHDVAVEQDDADVQIARGASLGPSCLEV